MNNKLYVGGLAWATTDDGLAQAFSSAGNVTSAKVITDRMSGRSRGFGFVEMASEEEAQKAIEMFHGKDLDGRVLTVNVAKPMEDRPAGNSRGFDRGPRDFSNSNRGFGGGRGGFQSRGGFGGGRGQGRTGMRTGSR